MGSSCHRYSRISNVETHPLLAFISVAPRCACPSDPTDINTLGAQHTPIYGFSKFTLRWFGSGDWCWRDVLHRWMMPLNIGRQPCLARGAGSNYTAHLAFRFRWPRCAWFTRLPAFALPIYLILMIDNSLARRILHRSSPLDAFPLPPNTFLPSHFNVWLMRAGIGPRWVVSPNDVVWRPVFLHGNPQSCTS
jgi:hypothetical protein